MPVRSRGPAGEPVVTGSAVGTEVSAVPLRTQSPVAAGTGPRGRKPCGVGSPGVAASVTGTASQPSRCLSVESVRENIFAFLFLYT